MRVTLKTIEHGVQKTSAKGTSYSATIISYTNEKGEIIERTLLSSDPIVAKLTEDLIGLELDFKFIKDGQYFKLVDAVVATGPAPAKTFNKPFTKTGASYNSEGARHGMIINNAVLLAYHRGTSDTIDGLKKAANDVIELTKFVEAGGAPITTAATKPIAKKAVAAKVASQPIDEEFDEDEDLFA